MLWTDRVFSTGYHRVNVTAKARAKMMVVVCNETPKLSTRLSVMSVPTTLIKTTASQ